MSTETDSLFYGIPRPSSRSKKHAHSAKAGNEVLVSEVKAAYTYCTKAYILATYLQYSSRPCNI